jgi:hypothetical protein
MQAVVRKVGSLPPARLAHWAISLADIPLSSTRSPSIPYDVSSSTISSWAYSYAHQSGPRPSAEREWTSEGSASIHSASCS